MTLNSSSDYEATLSLSILKILSDDVKNPSAPKADYSQIAKYYDKVRERVEKKYGNQISKIS